MNPVTVKFDHWLPKIQFWMSPPVLATTIGHSIYFRYTKEEAKMYPQMFKHELQHVHQVEAAGGFIPFLVVYIFQWISHGFKYMNIPYEVYAYGQQVLPFTPEEQVEWSRWFS